jgi:hypothetical protein
VLVIEVKSLPAAPIDGLPVWVPVRIIAAIFPPERICHCGVIMFEGWLPDYRFQMMLRTMERQRK